MSVAAAIVDDRHRVLAIRRRDNSKWEPPGGTLELEETPIDGLRREVKEETGLEVVPGPLTGVYKNMTRGIIALVFRCESDGATPVPTNEAAEVRWMNRSEIEQLLDPAYACRLLDALETDAPKIRVHDGVTVIA